MPSKIYIFFSKTFSKRVIFFFFFFLHFLCSFFVASLSPFLILQHGAMMIMMEAVTRWWCDVVPKGSLIFSLYCGDAVSNRNGAGSNWLWNVEYTYPKLYTFGPVKIQHCSSKDFISRFAKSKCVFLN